MGYLLRINVRGHTIHACTQTVAVLCWIRSGVKLSQLFRWYIFKDLCFIRSIVPFRLGVFNDFVFYYKNFIVLIFEH